MEMNQKEFILLLMENAISKIKIHKYHHILIHLRLFHDCLIILL